MMNKLKVVIFISFIVPAIIIGCDEAGTYPELDLSSNLNFEGTFRTIDSEKLTGTVVLNIANGLYECSTNLPFGRGAGKLSVNNYTIDFIDTLFFAIPAIYGPSYVLSGKHHYIFDGQNLSIWKEKNVGEIQYELKLIE